MWRVWCVICDEQVGEDQPGVYPGDTAEAAGFEHYHFSNRELKEAMQMHVGMIDEPHELVVRRSVQ